MMLVDTHCHLYLEKFDNDLEQVLQRSVDNGIKKIFLPAIDKETHQRVISLSQSAWAGGEFYAMMGVHPCSILANFEEELAIAKQYLDSSNKFYAIGEIGLDYYWDVSFKEQQIIAFERQIEWSIERNLPVAIHSRNSTGDCIASMRKFEGKAKGIFHCFSGTLAEAKEIIALGLYLGIGGVVTYKNTDLRETLQQVGLDNVVLETDAPYLAPIPYRGKINEPAYIKVICEAIAHAVNKPYEQVAEITTANALRVFQLSN